MALSSLARIVRLTPRSGQQAGDIGVVNVVAAFMSRR
jgi:hypothetical protein